MCDAHLFKLEIGQVKTYFEFTAQQYSKKNEKGMNEKRKCP